MDDKLNFSKIIEKNIQRFNMDPYSFLSKIKPKNYSIEFVFKDFNKNSKLKNNLLMCDKMSNMLYVELKKQINENEFNFDRFKKIISEFFKDEGFINIVRLILITVLFIFFKIQFTSFDIRKLFTIIIFPLFILNLYTGFELFAKEYKKSNSAREAIINIKKYYDDLKRNDLNFFQVLQALKFVLIFVIFVFFIFTKYLSNMDINGISFISIKIFLIKVASVLIFTFSYRLLQKLKSQQKKDYKYNEKNNSNINLEF